MSSGLQALIESIISDLIAVRAEADAAAADIATVYRDHEILRHMAVPALNIKNVAVELRMAFDETPVKPPSGPSEAQVKAAESAATAMRAKLLAANSVASTLTSSRQRSALSRKLSAIATKTSAESIGGATAERRALLNERIATAIGESGVRLSAADKRVLTAEVDTFVAEVAKAPKAKGQVPGLILGAEKLAEINPEAISVLRFDIDLTEAHWTDVDDGAGNVESLLRRETE